MNSNLTEEIARLRADPDQPHLNRMLASMLECLNNEGADGFIKHVRDLLGCVILTFGYAGVNIDQGKEIVDQIFEHFAEIILTQHAAKP